jgi:hypothetical protein
LGRTAPLDRLNRHDQIAPPHLQRQLDRLRQPRAHLGLEHQPVDHHLDVVPHLPVQRDPLPQRHNLAIHPRPHKPLFEEVLKQVLMLSLLLPDQRRQQRALRPRGQFRDPCNNLLRRLGGDRPATLGAMPLPDPGIQHAQVVVNLRDRAHGRAGVVPRRLLADGDRRRQPADVVHVRLGHLAQKVPGIARKALHIAPLPFRIERVERQRAFAAAADARQANQLMARQYDRDVAEVMFPRALYHDVRSRHILRAAGE